MAEQRNLILANPIAGNNYPTMTTLVAAYQTVKGAPRQLSAVGRGPIGKSIIHSPWVASSGLRCDAEANGFATD